MAPKKTPAPTDQPELPGTPPETEDANVLDVSQAPAADDVKTLNIYQRMHRAAGMISVLVKANQFGTGSYGFKYVSHDDTVAKVRLAFQPCGILAIMTVEESDLQIERTTETKGNETKERLNFIARLSATMVFVNVDNPDDRFEVKLPAYALDSSDKAMGKAISYAKKYALIALSGLMLATGQDVDQDNLEIERLRRNETPPQGAQKPPQGAQGNQRSTTRQPAGEGQGAQRGAAKDLNIPETIPADRERAQELLNQYVDADVEQLDAPILLALSDAYAVKLGCKIGNYATVAVYTATKGKPPHRTNVLSGFHRLAMLHGYWQELRDAVVRRHEGDEVKGKAALRDFAQAQGWEHIWELREPKDVKNAIALFTDAE